uniref:Metallophosphoesterase domain containing 1 n=1 Tax=Equus caballus TaxID=9796 RepID=F6V1V0_HORSE
MWRARWDPGVLKAEALALLPCGLGMAFSQSHVMAARRHQHSRLIIEVDEYSSNPTQAFTFYNINQGRFQPPHVQMVDPVPHDAPKPPGYTRFVCVSDTHSRTDPIQMPYGDVLIHAGDFTELGLPSEVKKFNEWLGYGVMADGTTTYVNASVCTVNYQPVNAPIVIDLPTPRNS